MDTYKEIRDKLESLAELACRPGMPEAAISDISERMWQLLGKLCRDEIWEMMLEDGDWRLRVAAGKKYAWDTANGMDTDLNKMRTLMEMENNRRLHPCVRAYANELREWIRGWFVERWGALSGRNKPEGERIAAGMELISNLEHNGYTSALEAIYLNNELPEKVRVAAGMKAAEKFIRERDCRKISNLTMHRDALGQVSRYIRARMEEAGMGKAEYEEFSAPDGKFRLRGRAEPELLKKFACRK